MERRNIRLRNDFRKEIINYGNDKHTNVQLAKRQRQALRLDCEIHPGEFGSLLRQNNKPSHQQVNLPDV